MAWQTCLLTVWIDPSTAEGEFSATFEITDGREQQSPVTFQIVSNHVNLPP
jgi:hypothetical protein